MKKCFRSSIVAVVCCSLLLLSAGKAYPQTMTPRYITTSENSHGYYEYLPAGYSSTGSQTYPLMIFLEGVGEHGNGTTDLSRVLNNGPAHLISLGQFPTSFTVNGQTFSFIIITPQWVNTPSQVWLDSLVQYVTANYKVDTTRIYLTGLSEGGALAWAYPGYRSAFATKVAAIVPVCGGYALNATEAGTIASGNVAVFGTHNMDDSSVSDTFTINDVKAINSANPPPAITALDTIFPDPDHNGHNAWLVTYDPTINVFQSKLNVYQWMLENTRKTAVNTPLPVTITDYTATVTPDGKAVDVDWVTAREMNNKYFILQRSGDGSRYINLDTIPAANPQGTGHSYIYRDVSPLPGNDFYRLEQVDINGATTVFGTLEVTLARPQTPTLQIGPNPCSGSLTLRLVNSEFGSLLLNLRDLQGNLLRTWQFEKQDTTWGQSIDLGGLPAGTYLLQVEGKTTSIVRTLIKE